MTAAIGFDFVEKVRFLVKCLSETELASFCEAKSFQTGIFILEAGLIGIILFLEAATHVKKTDLF